MSITIEPTTIRMTKGFEQHFCNSMSSKRGADSNFGAKLDRQLVNIDGGYRNHFLGIAFGMAADMVEDYPTGFWYLADLNHGDSFFIYPTERGTDLYRIVFRDKDNKPTSCYDLDEKTLGLLVTALSLKKTEDDATRMQMEADNVVKNGGLPTHHDADAAKNLKAKRVELINMVVNSTEEIAATTEDDADALANIALREFILSHID